MRNTTRQRIRRKAQTRPEADAPVTDAAGAAFDPDRHIAPDQFTKAGLFRLQPGKRR